MRSAAALAALLFVACSPATPSDRSTAARTAVPATADSAAATTSAAPPKLTAITSELPRDPATKLAAHARCGVDACRSGLLYPPGGEVDVSSPVLMWSQEIQPKATLKLPPHSELVLYGVVTSGPLAASGYESDLAAWSAFRLDGVGVALSAKGDTAAHAVFALVSPKEPVADVMQQKTGALAADRSLRVVDATRATDLAFAGKSSHVRILFEDEPASLQLMLTSTDAPVPPHQHDEEWEVIGLLQADGSFTLGGDARHTKTEAILAIPPKTPHRWQPSGDSRLLAVQLYVPPGPERRFKELAGK